MRLVRLLSVGALLFVAMGASTRTANFVISAPTPEFATQAGQYAEMYRQTLSEDWFGGTIPTWERPVPITITFGQGNGGATSFQMQGNGKPYAFTCKVFGTPRAILDSVLPHEIMHMVLHTHILGDVPRWIDEGICTCTEQLSEKERYEAQLVNALQTGRGIALSKLFVMREYPQPMQALYAQGASVCTFLLCQGPPKMLTAFAREGCYSGNWSTALQKYYAYQSPAELQKDWVDWVAKGSPEPTVEHNVAYKCRWVPGKGWVCDDGGGGGNEQVPAQPQPYQQNIQPAPVVQVQPARPLVAIGQQSDPRYQTLDTRVLALENDVKQIKSTGQEILDKVKAAETAVGAAAKESDATAKIAKQYEQDLAAIQEQTALANQELLQQNVETNREILTQIKNEKKESTTLLTTLTEKLTEVHNKVGVVHNKVDEVGTKVAPVVESAKTGGVTDAVLTAIPMLGKWFGLPGFAVWGLWIVSKMIKRRRSGRSGPFPVARRVRERLRSRRVSRSAPVEEVYAEPIAQRPRRLRVRRTNEGLMEEAA